ncbi:MAG TPA: hypothetical protein VL360_07435 [Gammaproteobacteria bacterium]|nr:hypothetical protein [Gammaproteobacteria bacterium]
MDGRVQPELKDFIEVLMKHLTDVQANSVTKNDITVSMIDYVTRIPNDMHNYYDTNQNSEHQNASAIMGVFAYDGRLFSDAKFGKTTINFAYMPRPTENAQGYEQFLNTYPDVKELLHAATARLVKEVCPLLENEGAVSRPEVPGGRTTVINEQIFRKLNSIIIDLVEPLASDPQFKAFIRDIAVNSLTNIERNHGNLSEKLIEKEEGYYRDLILGSLAYKLTSIMTQVNLPMFQEYFNELNTKRGEDKPPITMKMLQDCLQECTNCFDYRMSTNSNLAYSQDERDERYQQYANGKNSRIHERVIQQQKEQEQLAQYSSAPQPRSTKPGLFRSFSQTFKRPVVVKKEPGKRAISDPVSEFNTSSIISKTGGAKEAKAAKKAAEKAEKEAQKAAEKERKSAAKAEVKTVNPIFGKKPEDFEGGPKKK